ncbi:MAG: adenylate/guanylate cyclase domain-containing protein [Dongiaceae bacterium]
MECPHCGAALPRRRNFCGACGTALAACPACGGLNAAADAFCGDCGQALAGSVRAAAPAAAERRQLTVMFCDLVGSTALSQRLDPEDLQQVITAYQDCCAGLVARFDGAVAQYLGDGILVYFGYPQAHEDDAERSIRAALAVVEAVARLQPVRDVSLRVRVGIATGLVVTGELVGDPRRREHAVIGETPNLAARLQQIAEPGGVVIADATHRLVAGLFDCAPLGERLLKGFDVPVAAWLVAGERRAQSRHEVLQGGALTPPIGREGELELIERRWQEAKAGRGQVVLIEGEPGMGKSRLVQALRARLRGEPGHRIAYHASPYHQNTAFHAVAELVERGAGLRPGDPPATRLARLAAMLERSGTGRPEAVAALAALLDPEAAASGESAEAQRRRLAATVLDHLAGLAGRRPLLASFEDAGLLDPSTLELLGRLIERAQGLPMLLVVTFRPSFAPPWAGYPHVTPIRLERLDRERTLALIARIADGRPLPPATIEEIAARTDGVPLFVEELTRAALEAPRAAGESGPQPPPAIPASLQDSLMARLDRMARAKAVAQMAAAIGRVFAYDLLAAVSPLAEPELRSALEQLVEAGLVLRRGAPPQATYAFRHALVRDAAYASLLRRHRQELHAAIAAALEAGPTERVARQPELLAQHLSAAGLPERAILYWQKAADQATARSAAAEAIAHLERGLALAAALPPDRAQPRLELELRLALGGQLMAAKGPSAAETGEAYRQASELGRRLGAEQPLFAALYGLGAFHFCRAELDRSHAISEEILAIAERDGDAAGRLSAERLLAADLFMLGAFPAARDRLERALALFDPARHRELRLTYSYDSRVVTRMYLAWTRFMLGQARAALAEAASALAEARGLRHPHTLAYALDSACVLHQLAGERATVQKQAAALLVVAERQDYPYWEAQARMYRGWTQATGRGGAYGMAALRAGIAAHQATGAEIFVPYHLGLLAEAELAAGRPEPARQALADALSRVERSGERWFEAELHRLTGLALIGEGHEAAAETSLRRALAVAERQQARSWSLRAAAALAQLLVRGGRGTEAREVLGPVLAGFPAEEELAEVAAARRLLAMQG